ncbi:hypothetical protein SHKM778_83070 [Streptomyces sp. KM77-8]|uniref:Uncharacterized protein n=1 Tax=Streptomyces haneummycinicus TaxID=3074435 RepID=A0AAT9HXF3_9ACTN
MPSSVGAAGSGRDCPAGRRKTKVLPEAASASPAGVSAAWGAGAGAAVCGTLGSAPQETLRSWSPPKPDWWERSAPQAEAGSGRLPCCAWAGETAGSEAGAGKAGDGASAGSSSKKCGPVSSTAGRAGPAPDGEASDSPSVGAGRLVPGTQEAPFQYRTYPGMEGSG